MLVRVLEGSRFTHFFSYFFSSIYTLVALRVQVLKKLQLSVFFPHFSFQLLIGAEPHLVVLVAILSVRKDAWSYGYITNKLPGLFQRCPCKDLQSRDDCSTTTVHCI